MGCFQFQSAKSFEYPQNETIVVGFICICIPTILTPRETSYGGFGNRKASMLEKLECRNDDLTRRIVR